jgi:hypothetical protein
MKKLYILPLLAASLLATGCSKDDPFGSSDGVDGDGKLLKSALAVEVKADAIIREQRTRSDANIDDFNLIFTRDGQSAPAAKYKYGEMPEVITLPAGNYTVTATYGEDRDAAWNSPYYLGKSETFEVRAYEITSYIDPIECTLENVMVSILFDSALANSMSDDSYVVVKVGDNDGLKFTSTEAAAETPGYFRHSDETTLVATFYGTVDGAPVVETKSYTNVQKGYHYRLTFALHNHSTGATGDANADVTVDGKVEVIDVARNVELGEDTLLDDSERPSDGSGTQGGGGTEKKEPSITVDAPVSFDKVNTLYTGDLCELHLTSYADGGFQAVTCQIVSSALTPEELATVNLSDNIDLVNTPDSMAESLKSLGFPVNIGGQSSVDLSLTNFVPMLAAFSGVEHDFIITVTDANGTTSKTLKLVCY